MPVMASSSAESTRRYVLASSSEISAMTGYPLSHQPPVVGFVVPPLAAFVPFIFRA